MNRTVVAAALALFATVATVATAAPELKVTAYEAGLDSGTPAAAVSANTGIVPPDFKPAPAAPAPATKFIIVGTITLDSEPVWKRRFRHEPFDDEAACKAFIESDDGLKASVASIQAQATARYPDAKAGASCEEFQAAE